MKRLLSFAEAQLAGQAMFDRWEKQAEVTPPLEREDAAWADLARVAWDAVQSSRHPKLVSLAGLGFPDYGYTADFNVVRTTAARGTRIGKLMKPFIDVFGYVNWRLCASDGRSRAVRRSAIVCTHYHGPRPKGMLALHGDGNPQNDSRDNLRWGTPAENMADMVRHGRAGRTRGMRHGSRTKPESVCRGEAHGMAKITEEQARAIHASRESGPALSRKYGVGVSRINQIKNGQGWGL